MTPPAAASDRVKVSTTVSADPERTFEIFTEEVDLWWKHGPRFRLGAARESTLRFEPGPGGRLVEVYGTGGFDVAVLGRVKVWDPGKRLAFEMGGRAFAPGDPWPLVDVRFESREDGTRVTLEMSGFERLPPDHGVFHGLEGDAFHGMMGLWWADLLVALRARLRERELGP
jgi:uncharacterized protein YndB with AHSA1/START domain